MGKRHEPRKAADIKVRIFGTDVAGKIFSETVGTVDVSHSGMKLRGVRARVNVDEIVGVTYGGSKAHFRVKWTKAAEPPAEGELGLLNLTPEKPFWDFPLPQGVVDTFRTTVERRHSPRMKCSISVELQRPGEAVIWGKASDISLGGCFIEMPIPLPMNTSFEIALWLADTKVKLQAQVASVAPGFGMGVRFTEVSPASQELIRRHLAAMS